MSRSRLSHMATGLHTSKEQAVLDQKKSLKLCLIIWIKLVFKFLVKVVFAKLGSNQMEKSVQTLMNAPFTVNVVKET